MTLPFAISGEPTVEKRRGKRQSWSMQRELRVSKKIRVFHRSSKREEFSLTLVPFHLRVVNGRMVQPQPWD